MSLKRVRLQLERHAPRPGHPLPVLVVSCADPEHDPRVRVVQVGAPDRTFASLAEARAWLRD
jgi:hypothetical protein